MENIEFFHRYSDLSLYQGLANKVVLHDTFTLTVLSHADQSSLTKLQDSKQIPTLFLDRPMTKQTWYASFYCS
jgi:hypothetical protein